MTIRLIHSNNVTNNRADIVNQYNDIYFDDVANSILLPDPTGLLETKIGASGSSGIKGFASGYVDAGQFVTLDNIKATVTTTGNRGLSVAAVTGTFVATVSANYSLTTGSNGHSTAYPGSTYSTTPSGSFFNYHFPNAGDGSTYLLNDYNNQKFYRIILMIGPSYLKNFISIERLI